MNNIYLRDIPGYPGYKLTQDHHVMGKTGKLLSESSPDGCDYKFVNVFVNSRSNILYLHRAIALVHVKGYFDGAWVDHIDNDPSNNDPTNLRWVTPMQNHACNKNTSGDIKRIDRMIAKLQQKIDSYLKMKELYLADK